MTYKELIKDLTELLGVAKESYSRYAEGYADALEHVIEKFSMVEHLRVLEEMMPCPYCCDDPIPLLFRVQKDYVKYNNPKYADEVSIYDGALDVSSYPEVGWVIPIEYCPKCGRKL